MTPQDLVTAGPLVISPEYACAAWLAGEPMPLGIRQVRVLAVLVRAGGRLCSREVLYHSVTGSALPIGSRTIDMDLWRIRKALGPFARYLRSVRKVGYALDVTGLQGFTSNEGVTESFRGGDASDTGT